ncbi:outer membrane lipoprotein carrier protein LolA [Acidithiobacillus thiooxidans]|uniref:Outer-membrane lipoprotein carrier protein n=1 Tax=Acidithiobacillus thiooxidans TaxID=930 RepID=A0A1C2J726_ACITH|nr:outer membrane lipoprotein chaperone LolA [Acidithiobacillus thiooxidans]OCX68308.1 outer membrane lipoprotein carrier protein LolA [Acidithiobacillus thiooxidans]OCX70830.1 outer membrane lipoprotein carrier protein LolA [Acidithiobacillus thiooxidans]OCX77886.1 outer membrane lipoprotein carrier protein LolA [Acidithiobacillus thiooxidans]OCX80537.1 outer membrane lipoprotein carrier protein LolA [Acidithiobacillus thiooxidans]OCX84034.1 outer membrane lipoprotein carrier protein LolA [Ac
MQQHHPVVIELKRRSVSRYLQILGAACLLGWSAWANAASGQDMLHHFFQSTHTITAQFSQEVANHNGQIVKKAGGTLWISRPGKFRWDYSGPNGQTIVSNGLKVWLYEPALQQVTVQPLGKALGSTPAALIAGNDDLSQRFNISDLGVKNQLHWLLLRPKNGQDQGFTALRLGFDTAGILKEMRMEDAFQQETVLHFTHVEINHAIPSHEFQFTTPAGVDVLSQ